MTGAQQPDRRRLLLAWRWWWQKKARDKQRMPADALWRIWLILSGRGWGKTRVGAETVVRWALERAGVRIALVAATFDDGRDVMVEGESGVESVLQRYGVRYTWNRSLGQLLLANGSRMDLYSGEKPRQLRGPQHHYAWCDELAHWKYPRATWDMLRFGLRLGRRHGIRNRTIVTTTPIPIPLLHELIARRDCHLTVGSMYENEENLTPEFVEELRGTYEDTELGEQELHGVLLVDVKGAAWTRATLELARHAVEVPDLDRITVGFDPAAKGRDATKHDAHGIVVMGRAKPAHADAAWPDLPHLYVLEALQVYGTPVEACRELATAYHRWDADAVAIEDNNGGDWLPAVLHAVDQSVKAHTVHAPAGLDKMSRARPYAALYQQQRAHHVGRQPLLEDEMVTFTGAESEASPNVLDAAVWAADDLLPPSKVRRRERRRGRLVDA